MNKKNMRSVFIDIDDVIANTSSNILSLANDLFGKKIIYEDLTSFSLEKTLKLSSDEMKKFFEKLHSNENLMKILPVKEAKDSLKKIKKMGYMIYLITGRIPETYGITKKWLEKNFYSYDFLYFVDKYSRYKKNNNEDYILTMEQLADINFTFVIEDSILMAEWFKKRETRIVILDHPWNREIDENPLIKRCFNWNEILEYMDLTKKKNLF